MCLCMCMYVYIRMCIHRHARKPGQACRLYIHSLERANTCVCVCACMYTYMCACIAMRGSLDKPTGCTCGVQKEHVCMRVWVWMCVHIQHTCMCWHLRQGLERSPMSRALCTGRVRDRWLPRKQNMHVCIFRYMCVCIYIYTHINIYIYTYMIQGLARVYIKK